MPFINVELIQGVLAYTAWVIVATAAAGFIAMPTRASDVLQSEQQVAAISSSSSSSEMSREAGIEQLQGSAVDDARTIEQA